MNRRPMFVAGLFVAGSLLLLGRAHAAVSQVHVGNFYFEDATVGDGKVEIRQGDQLRFVMDDNGPGTPHTVEIDALGIHSGALVTGETYTTPPIQQTGSFEMYCKPHDNRGHVTTLVVLPSTTATTTAPPTTVAPTTTIGATPPTTNGSTGTTSPTAPTPDPAPVGEDPIPDPGAPVGASPDGATTATVPGVEPTTADPSGATATTLAPTGRGEATEEELETRLVDPDSLEAVLGRPLSSKGPWTRSVKMALVGLLPLVAAAAMALGRFARSPSSLTTDDGVVAPEAGRPSRARPLQAQPGAIEPG